MRNKSKSILKITFVLLIIEFIINFAGNDKTQLISAVSMILTLIIGITLSIIVKFKSHKSKQTLQNNIVFYTKPQKNNYSKENSYNQKPLMTECELQYYKILQNEFAKEYIIQSQINLASIINKKKEFENQYQNELFRNIDFGIFDFQGNCLLLIEINDKSHNELKRIERDIKVNEICKHANITLLTFNSFDYLTKGITTIIKRHLNDGQKRNIL